MDRLLSHIKKLDWILVASSLGLIGIGSLSIYSSSVARDDFGNLEKQAIFLGIGLLTMFIISLFDYRLLRNDSYFILLLYGIGIAALAGLFVFAPEIRGIKGWYRIGGISVDPIEYMKLILIVLMAKYFALRHIEVYRIRHILLTGAYFAVPILLIALQPDLGPALVLMILWGVLLLAAGIRFKHFFGIVSLGILTIAIGWSFLLVDYQKDRILSFVEPELDPLGIGWSQLQAKIAIGNGGILGRGITQGTQTQFGFLSEPQTDFIFAATAEEMGIFAVILLLSLLAILVWRIFRIGVNAKDNFSRLYATGFATIIIIQTFVNVGMNLGLLPIIGLSLPFVSYGGSALIFTYIGLGFLLSIKTH
jgi:rod shape determining protein RodA